MTTETNQKVYQYIKKHRRVRPVELVRLLGFTQAAIHRQLNKLLNRKLVEKAGKPPKVYYQIPRENLETQLQTALAKNKNIVSAYIFGSINNAESDFDLAVMAKNLSENEVYDLIKRIKFPRNLDLSVVNKKSSPLFLFQIISTGKRVFEKSFDEAIAFEDFMLCNYYDTQRLRDLNYFYLKQKFAYAH